MHGKMVYQFRAGARVKGIDAQVAGEELERIRTRHGKLETTVIVAEARPVDAPLHPAFEWNNKIASEQWRLHQARHLARSLEVRAGGSDSHSAEDGDGEFAPLFVHVRAIGEEPPYYQSVVVVAKNPDERERALAELRSKVDQANEALETFSRLFAGKSRKTRSQIKKAGAALSGAKAAIAEIAS